MWEDLRGPPTWWLHTRLCNFVRNISTNISALGQRTHLELGELSSLFVVYNITICWLYPLHRLWFYFLLRDIAHTLYLKGKKKIVPLGIWYDTIRLYWFRPLNKEQCISVLINSMNGAGCWESSRYKIYIINQMNFMISIVSFLPVLIKC